MARTIEDILNSLSEEDRKIMLNFKTDKELLEKKYSNLTDLLPIAVFEVNTSGKIISANREALQFTGYSIDEINKGLKVTDIVADESLPLFIESFKKLSEGIKLTGNEYVLKHKDGSKKIGFINTRLDDLDKHTILGYIFDLTRNKEIENKLKENELKLKRAENIAKIGYWEYDIRTNVISGSDEAVEIYGFVDMSNTMLLHKIRDVVVDPLKNKEALENLITKNIPYDLFFEIHREDNGELRHIHSQAELIYESGCPIKVVGAIQDITKKKNDELEKERLNQKIIDNLEKSIAEKDILIKEVHHRVKNNLQIISSMFSLYLTQRLEDKISEKDLRELYSAMESRITGIGSLYNQLLKQNDYYEINSESYLSNLIKNIVSTYECNSDYIECSIDINNTKLTIDDAVTTGLLLNELISNSIIHGFTNCERFEKIKVIFDENGITYSDNGIGFDNNSKNEGIGTILIEQFAKQLKLSVNIYSDSNGTSYVLKKELENKNNNIVDVVQNDLSLKNELRLHDAGIYVVEDEAIIALERINFLKRNGYSVINKFASSCEEVIEYLKNNNPSLILMDIGLGNNKLSGIEVLKKIRSNSNLINNDIPVIFISGYTKETYISELADIKYEGFLTKPYNGSDLKKIIDSLL